MVSIGCSFYRFKNITFSITVFDIIFYHLQTKFAKVMFSQEFVCPQVGTLGLCPGVGAFWGYHQVGAFWEVSSSRCLLWGVIKGVPSGGVIKGCAFWGCHQGGCLLGVLSSRGNPWRWFCKRRVP